MPKPTLEYLSNYAPLTQTHAETVVAVAGADLDDDLKRKIDEAVKDFEQVASAVVTN